MARRKPTAKKLANQRRFAAMVRAKAAGRKRQPRKPEPPMARKTRRFSRARAVARRGYSAANARVPTSQLLWAGGAGAAAPYAQQFLGPWGAPATMLAAGYMGKNPALATIGAVGLGGTLVRQFSAGTPFAAPDARVL